MTSAVTETPVMERRSFRRWGGGPLARAVARAPVSVRAKHLVGFGVVVVLLLVVAAAGLLALRHSNSRVEQLRIEQQKTGLVQNILALANGLQTFVTDRSNVTYARGTTGVTPSPNIYYQTLDADIGTAVEQLFVATQLGHKYGSNQHPAGVAAYFERFYPAVYADVQTKIGHFNDLVSRLNSADTAGRGGSAKPLVDREGKLAQQLVDRLTRIGQQAQRRTNELAAANHSSFVSSRNLLIGVSAGSLAVALALGLLISWSLVVPLRRTGARMAEIAAGDFTGHLEVPNRDEIGTLAKNVNQMSDELGRLYKELETASRHKSDFLATMSHELRTPLNAIIGFSEVLQEQMFGDLNERQLAYVNDVLGAGRHLLSLINDVLDLAKIEAGRMELELTLVSIPDLLRSAVSMHSERADRAGIELNLSTEPEEIIIVADELRVRQIVFNLFSNAVKFTPADGRIDVAARLNIGEVEIDVADTGHGIAAQDLETIFEEFEQTSEGKQAEGTGLGLPLSRKLAELHGGRLWADSKPGKGSTFHLTLPVSQDSRP
jgi:signal transduction histidine kinase